MESIIHMKERHEKEIEELKNKMKMNIHIRIKLLNEIFEEFQQITQWIPEHLDIAHSHQQRAEALIDFLEVDDCGSIGGYDKHNPVHRITGIKRYDRFLALVGKYNNEKDIKKVCCFNLNTLGDYLKIVNGLRKRYYVFG